MLVYYMLSRGTHPYHADSNSKIEQNIVDDKPDLSSVGNDPVVLDLVQTMLTANPDDRPSAEDLLRWKIMYSNCIDIRTNTLCILSVLVLHS